ncbi:MAG: NADH:ubiquinone reductase (Na(+)-transporting) subunit A [Gammaproteobacteria bacterium]
MIKLTKGLDLPITGKPGTSLITSNKISRVGIRGFDFSNLKPTMLVNIGDKVKAGQRLLENKKNPGQYITAPVSGVISEINRGEKRKFLSIVIEQNGDTDFIEFNQSGYDLLIESGFINFFRTRPFNRVPDVGSKPEMIFVNACNSNPLSVDPNNLIHLEQTSFNNGLQGLLDIFNTKVICSYSASNFAKDLDSVSYHQFSGPHPAGLVSTHIHFISPVSLHKTHWTISYQDVIALGKLIHSKKIYSDRIISLGGEGFIETGLVKTVLGADLTELCSGNLKSNSRLISGSVLYGLTALDPNQYLGYYDNQISCIPDESNDIFMNWAMPGKSLHSKMNTFLSSFIKPKKYIFNTSLNGGHRSIVPLPAYDEVMPLNILPIQLLKALATYDIELSVKLGALELAPEDMGLLSYVCPSKYDYQSLLQENLDLIYKEYK